MYKKYNDGKNDGTTNEPVVTLDNFSQIILKFNQAFC